MKLVIIISGLVLLAPDRDNGRLHLFLPQMDMSHPNAEHHAPFLRYTSAKGLRNEPLAGWTLDLGTLARPGAAAALPAPIMRMDAFYRGVPREWVTGTPSRRVQGRLSLPWPDSFSVIKTAMWRLERGGAKTPVRLTNEVELEYDSLTLSGAGWKLASLRGAYSEKEILAMRPGGSTDTIRIFNVPPGEGTELKRGDEGVHFRGYVDVLRRRPIDWMRPRPFLYLDDVPRKIVGMSPYNCMLAAAPLY